MSSERAEKDEPCEHGIRWPWACDDCDRAEWADHQAQLAATPPPASADALGEVAEDLAREIADLFEDASNNPCTCNIDENSCRHCSAWVRAAHTTKERLTAAMSAMSPAGEVERIVAWLRADADLTEVEAAQINKNTTGNPRGYAAEWAMLVRVKRGLADAIERGDYRHD